MGVGMPSHRSTSSFGKRQEFGAIAELLKRDYDVYLTLVDDQQIDCIIRLEREPFPIYVDVQIKARSENAKHPGSFASLEIRKPRPNFYFIFYSEAAGEYWVIPSLEVVELATKGKSGKAKGRYRLVLTSTNVKGQVRPRPKWKQWQNNFALISSAKDPRTK
jgi:hypothetical protein